MKFAGECFLLGFVLPEQPAANADRLSSFLSLRAGKEDCPLRFVVGSAEDLRSRCDEQCEPLLRGFIRKQRVLQSFVGVAQIFDLEAADRKSTRLNSSHLVI